jgi:hypothetical protein
VLAKHLLGQVIGYLINVMEIGNLRRSAVVSWSPARYRASDQIDAGT